MTLLLTSSGQDITTDINGQNGKMTLLLTSSSQEWQFHTATDIYWSRMEIY